jgi:hypothetical protein
MYMRLLGLLELVHASGMADPVCWKCLEFVEFAINRHGVSAALHVL